MRSLLSTISTGFQHDDKPVIPEEVSEVVFEESIKSTIDTGFGSGTLHKQCPQSELVQYLIKGNFLSEFKTEVEKTYARENLGVYSKEKVDQLLESITNNVGNLYVTKTEVQEMMTQIQFVDSQLKGYAAYEIPNNLFRL